MIINIPFDIKVTSVQNQIMIVRTHTHVEVLLSPFLAVNPMGLTNGHSELVNGFYVDSWTHIMTNCLQGNVYNNVGKKIPYIIERHRWGGMGGFVTGSPRGGSLTIPFSNSFVGVLLKIWDSDSGTRGYVLHEIDQAKINSKKILRNSPRS